MSAIEAPPCTTPRRWKLTTAEFERMVELGVFAEDDRIELIDGELYEMPPAGDWHNWSVGEAGETLYAAAQGRAKVWIQNSIRLDEHSSPEPDVALLVARPGGYPKGVTPADVLLVIEVSDTSVRFDREVKLPLYARAGIPEVWIVTRDPAVIEAYRSPREGVYTEMRTYLRGDTISPHALPDVKIRVSDVTG
jgi:Uma2 family endonuclease